MTNKRKIQILEKAKKSLIAAIERKYYRLGMCYNIGKNMRRREINIETSPYNGLDFWGISEPKKKTNAAYYFPRTKAGHLERIKSINKAIKKLSK